MKVLLAVNNNKDLNYAITKEIASFLLSKKVSVILEDDIACQIPGTCSADSTNLGEIDFAIILGGDGTIIRKAHLYKNYGINILGINLGRVGCLTEGDPNNYKDVINRVLDGNYKVEKRITLGGNILRQNGESISLFAVNDIVLYRGERHKMIDINIKINDSNSTTFYADGVIVATPTGSSAYSLSAGGPLVYPTAKTFVITPICAQLKTITSLVVSSDDKISVSFRNKRVDDNNPCLEIDGKKSYQIDAGDKIEIFESKETLNIIKVNLEESLYEPIFKVTNTAV
ncbi:MAG: NAD(+)/NADH kinase [Bacilli bacterium]|nr:NAD(+)/NADH kinase [Bacilli bacterium]